MKKIILLLFIAFAFTACKPAIERPFSKANFEEDVQSIKEHNELSADSLNNLGVYILLNEENSKILEGKTYKELSVDAEAYFKAHPEKARRFKMLEEKDPGK